MVPASDSLIRGYCTALAVAPVLCRQDDDERPHFIENFGADTAHAAQFGNRMEGSGGAFLDDALGKFGTDAGNAHELGRRGRVDVHGTIDVHALFGLGSRAFGRLDSERQTRERIFARGSGAHDHPRAQAFERCGADARHFAQIIHAAERLLAARLDNALSQVLADAGQEQQLRVGRRVEIDALGGDGAGSGFKRLQ